METINKRFIKKYSTNSQLMFAAAESLGYKVEKILVNEKSNVSRFGFTVSHNKKQCYISEKCIFPGVPKWQASLSGNKIVTDSLLKRMQFEQIITVFFDYRTSYTKTDLLSKISVIKFPVVIKPVSGSDGKGMYLVNNKKDAYNIIQKMLLNNCSALLQPNTEGHEYRIFSSARKVLFIHKKKFPVIVGDGKSKISELIKEITYLDRSILEKELSKNKYTLDTIMPPNEVLKTHFTKKTDPEYFESTNISAPIKKWATKLCTELSADTLGIDVFIEGPLSNPEKITIIELNSNPGLRYLSKYYDDDVTPVKIARQILQHYFK